METGLVFLEQGYNPLANGVVLVMGVELQAVIPRAVGVVQVQLVVAVVELAKSMISAESLLIMLVAVAQSILQVVQVAVVVVGRVGIVSTLLQIPAAVVQVA